MYMCAHMCMKRDGEQKGGGRGKEERERERNINRAWSNWSFLSDISSQYANMNMVNVKKHGKFIMTLVVNIHVLAIDYILNC